MTPERWRLVREIFEEAVELAPGEVAAFLEQKCSGDSALLAEVRAMVAEHHRSGILGHGVWSPAPAPVEDPPAEQTLFAPGDLVAGRYRILRYISRGGMGAVYEAEHPILPDHIALKCLLPAIANDEAMIERFKREIGLALKIAHPNVCRAFNVEWHQANPSSARVYFLTMEYLAGETLSERISARGRLGSAEALPILRQVAAGLSAAHAALVVHGDLKPSNVMLVASRAVVTDFGLARSVRPVGLNGVGISADAETTLTLSNAVAGTLDYMAPEMLRGAPASVQSDVYALGMVAYKMVVGALPFASDPPLGAAFRRTAEAVPSPRLAVPELDARLERAILGSLEIDPARRFRTVAEFVSALDGDPATGDSSFTGPVPVPVQWRLSRRQAMATAGVLAAGAGGGAGFWLWSRNRNRPSPEAERLYQQGVDNIHAGAYFAATKALERAVQSAPGFAPARARLAEAWLELGQPERASTEFLVVRRLGNSGLTRPERLQIEALDLLLTREFAAAAKKYEELVAEVGEQDGGVQVDLGRTYEKASNENAIEAYKHAATGPMRLPAAWLRLGVLYQRKKEIAQSNAAFAEAERGYAQSSNLEGLTELTLQRGVAANRSSQYAEAEVFLGKAIERARDAGNLSQEISAKLTLANVQYAQGRAERAEALAQEALSAAQTNQLEYLSIRGLLNLGSSLRLKGDYTGAQRYFENGLALASRTRSTSLAALSRLNLASLFAQLHRAKEQIEAAGLALEYYKPNHFAKETFQALTIQGLGQQYLGNYQGALAAFQRLLDEAIRANDQPNIADAHQYLGIVLSDSEDLPKALEQYKLFLAAATGSYVAYAARNCAIVLARLGRHTEAIPKLAQAEALVSAYPALGPSLARCRAEMALMRNKYQEATAACRKGLAIPGATPFIMVDLTSILGVATIRSGEARLGLAKCKEAREAARKLDDTGLARSTALAVLEGMLAVRDIPGATALFHELEPTLDSFPATKLFALGLMSRIDTQYVERGRVAVEKIRSLWGREALEIYVNRPDLKDLERRFV